MDEKHMTAKIEKLKDQVRVLVEENAQLRLERDLARADAAAWLPEATPEQEEEMRRAFDTGVPDGLATLIAELEAGGVR